MMHHNRQACVSASESRMATAALALLIAFATVVLVTPAAKAQTFTVLYSFTGGTDGALPGAGMTVDRAGNLYGSTEYGGDLSCFGGGEGLPNGCGVLFKEKKAGSGWLFDSIYVIPAAQAGYDSNYPGGLAIGPNGSLYGITNEGGIQENGTVFNVSPPATSNAFAPWNYNLLLDFTGNNGAAPTRLDPLRFDSAGNVYGAATYGGPDNDGVIYKLSPSGGGWTESVLYSFTGGSDGYHLRGMTFDDQGNIYGVAAYGGNSDCEYGCGTVYKLTPSKSGWKKITLHVFQQGIDGGWPGPLIRDKKGNLYGLTEAYGPDNNGGTVWELSPSHGGWTFSVLQSFPTSTVEDYGPYPLTMDAAGNLYGISNWGGTHTYGFLFELTPSKGGWSYTDLFDFGANYNACVPQGAPILDAAGNIYGVTEHCGAYGLGTVWEFTP
jgi:uncharacterized repeat protein (TIGR03803 family)